MWPGASCNAPRCWRGPPGFSSRLSCLAFSRKTARVWVALRGLACAGVGVCCVALSFFLFLFCANREQKPNKNHKNGPRPQTDDPIFFWSPPRGKEGLRDNRDARPSCCSSHLSHRLTRRRLRGNQTRRKNRDEVDDKEKEKGGVVSVDVEAFSVLRTPSLFIKDKGTDRSPRTKAAWNLESTFDQPSDKDTVTRSSFSFSFV